jgi:hypothetical protein
VVQYYASEAFLHSANTSCNEHAMCSIARHRLQAIRLHETLLTGCHDDRQSKEASLQATHACHVTDIK